MTLNNSTIKLKTSINWEVAFERVANANFSLTVKDNFGLNKRVQRIVLQYFDSEAAIKLQTTSAPAERNQILADELTRQLTVLQTTGNKFGLQIKKIKNEYVLIIGDYGLKGGQGVEGRCAGALAGAAQIAGGVTLIVLTGGWGAFFGGGFISSGVNGLVYSLTASDEDLSIKGYAKQSAIGVTTGLITGGIAVAAPATALGSVLSGAAGSVSQPVVTAVVEGKTDELTLSSLAKEAAFGAITGGTGRVAGKVLKPVQEKMGDVASKSFKKLSEGINKVTEATTKVTPKTLPSDSGQLTTQIAKKVGEVAKKAGSEVLKRTSEVLDKVDGNVVNAALTGGVGGAISHSAIKVADNYYEGKPLREGLPEAFATGVSIGAITSGIAAKKNASNMPGNITKPDKNVSSIVAPLPPFQQKGDREQAFSADNQSATSDTNKKNLPEAVNKTEGLSPIQEPVTENNTQAAGKPEQKYRSQNAATRSKFTPPRLQRRYSQESIHTPHTAPNPFQPSSNAYPMANPATSVEDPNVLFSLDNNLVLNAKRKLGEDLKDLGLSVPKVVAENEGQVRELLHRAIVQEAVEQLKDPRLSAEYRSHLERVIDPLNAEVIRNVIFLSPEDSQEWQRDISRVVNISTEGPLNPELAENRIFRPNISIDNEQNPFKKLDDKINAIKTGIETPHYEQRPEIDLDVPYHESRDDTGSYMQSWTRSFEEFDDDLISLNGLQTSKISQILNKLYELYTLQAERAEAIFNGYRQIPNPQPLPDYLRM